MGQRSDRIGSLDGLRGIAALVVLLHHTLLPVPALGDVLYGSRAPSSTGWLVYSPLHVFWAGGEAVYVFFILSGFVLTLPILAKGPDWRAYYSSRLVRLYLPVIGSVVLALIIAMLIPRVGLGDSSAWIGEHEQALSPVSVMKDLTLIDPDLLNSPLWSLRWEVAFSVLLPVYVFVAVRTRRYWLAVLIVAVLLSTVGAVVQQGWLTYLPMFMIGCVLAARREHLVPLVQSRGAAWALTAALVGITAFWWVSSITSSAHAEFATPLVLASAAAIVVLAIRWATLSSALETKPAQWLGRNSFSLYLTHEPIVVSVAILLPASLPWLTPFIGIPIALLVAPLFFRFVEGPSHMLAKRVASVVRSMKQPEHRLAHAPSGTAPDRSRSRS
jgi:peptidoglycan/LPS O-acetylase OafA/YrhL